MLHRTLPVLLVAAALGLTGRPAVAGESKTIRLVVAMPAGAAKADQQLTATLISILEEMVASSDEFSLIQWPPSPQGSKPLVPQVRPPQALPLVPAAAEAPWSHDPDLYVVLEILPRTDESLALRARVRVVDAKTGALRGVTAAGLDDETVEEAAEQFARYVLAPQLPTVAVAVLPFENKGRVGRLWPLEIGVRDLVISRLLALSSASDRPPAAKNEKTIERPARFQVVGRSTGDQFLRDLASIEPGLLDSNRAPETLPPRGAAYLIRGEIDQGQAEGNDTLIVRGEIVDAATMRPVDAFALESAPGELETRLAECVDRFGLRLSNEAKIPLPANVATQPKAESFKQLAMTDMRRFSRLSPVDYSVRNFRLAGEAEFRGKRPGLPTFSPLGRHVLRRSIDRLESLLLMTPDDADVAYALGFCYSIHEEGIYLPDRADEMLRRAHSLAPESEVAALALGVLGEITFDVRTRKLDPGSEAKTIEQLLFAFEHMPAAHRDHRWPRYLYRISEIYQQTGRNDELAILLNKAAAYAENSAGQHHYSLGSAVNSLAVQLAKQSPSGSPQQKKAIVLLRRWAEGEDQQFASFAWQGLASIYVQQKDFLNAAMAPEECALKMGNSKLPKERDQHEALRIEAVKNYRLAGKPERGLQLLLAFAPKPEAAPNSFLVGMHRYETGACYEALAEPDKALANYLQAAEAFGLLHSTDLAARIVKLGGIALRQDRQIDVRYFPDSLKRPIGDPCLATDGRKIYVGARDGLHAFDVASETWERAMPEQANVVCLKCDARKIWVGTTTGLWRCDLPSGQWKQIEVGPSPQPCIHSMIHDGQNIYVGVGTPRSGSLARIDADENVSVFTDELAPHVAPTDIVIAGNVLLARTPKGTYTWSLDAKRWSAPQKIQDATGGFPPFTDGNEPVKKPVWVATAWGGELTRPEWDARHLPRFTPARRGPAHESGLALHLVAERGDEIWFGGQQDEPLMSSGLYRLNRKTGDFYKFGPADGFKVCPLHIIYDGFWLDDRLWLLTSEGLCVVIERK